ncbi:MAG TPA: glycoside hydrolase family 3 N-terminal domain-containing protein [Anaerolineales bacterium]|nr:glycoside hydrolase family 3 N-terminal domain-containing protein [Anaerolineales bacterium]
MRLKRLFLTVGLSALLSALIGTSLPARAQTAVPPPEVRQLFDAMTPEERVGQLFLVTFTGTDTGQQSQIYDLIAHHYVGGVVLSAGNDNFVASPNTVTAAYQLVQGLQDIEWNTAQDFSGTPSATPTAQHAYVPLFIATTQDGDGSPGDQLLNGLTPLPSEMAIGASWQPDLANQVGSVMGQELSSLGVNMYFGPSLDVVDLPNPSANGDLGSSVFGGDPYWVSQMGSAYISGLHVGSQNKMLVIAKHFPGEGSSDRPNAEEVATVRKSLDQLKQIDLSPFFAVTGDASSSDTTADGLLVSHIRYQGFQGNIRATTRPVSFDPQALTTILSLPEFGVWHDRGGLLVSDDLGTNAVRQFYTSGTSFPAQIVARDAFVAGNDLLYLGNIVSSDEPDSYSSVLEILNFFVQKYLEDPTFAQRVDSSVLRILSQKYRLYGSFDIANVLVPKTELDNLGQSQSITLDVARRSATLISPDPQDLATLIPSPPQAQDHMVFITDSEQLKQCTNCPPQPNLDVNALQSEVAQLVSPHGVAQNSFLHLSSYSLNDISAFLAGNNPPSNLESDLSHAAWVVISLADANNGQPQIISRFLSEHQDLLSNKHVILFTFGAPYYFDATDISHLTAYYALYSKQPPFIEVAARLLFQELTPAGASPVSVTALGYDLISITSPDPNQIISLNLDLPAAPVPTGSSTPISTPVPTAVPLFKIGDTIAIRTGVINDHNGNPVPDGTVVHFSMTLTGEGGNILQEADATTTSGIARVSFGLDKPGLLEIRATSDPANVSEVLQLDVSAGQAAAITVIVPVQTTETAVVITPTPPPEQNPFMTRQGAPLFSAWLLTVILLFVGALIAFFVGNRLESRQWGIRWGLCALSCGLLAYNYFAFGLPGSQDFAISNGMGGILVIALLGLLIGWGLGWLWSQIGSG